MIQSAEGSGVKRQVKSLAIDPHFNFLDADILERIRSEPLDLVLAQIQHGVGDVFVPGRERRNSIQEQFRTEDVCLGVTKAPFVRTGTVRENEARTRNRDKNKQKHPESSKRRHADDFS